MGRWAFPMDNHFVAVTFLIVQECVKDFVVCDTWSIQADFEITGIYPKDHTRGEAV